MPAVVIRDACRAIGLKGSVERAEAAFEKAGVSVVDASTVQR
jgi:hypothetical protein